MAFFPNIDTARIWAEWNLRKIPNYTLFYFKHYIPQLDLYVFQERKTKRTITKNLDTIYREFITGTFRPFVIVTPQSPEPQGGRIA